MSSFAGDTTLLGVLYPTLKVGAAFKVSSIIQPDSGMVYLAFQINDTFRCHDRKQWANGPDGIDPKTAKATAF